MNSIYHHDYWLVFSCIVATLVCVIGICIAIILFGLLQQDRDQLKKEELKSRDFSVSVDVDEILDMKWG